MVVTSCVIMKEAHTEVLWEKNTAMTSLGAEESLTGNSTVISSSDSLRELGSQAVSCVLNRH